MADISSNLPVNDTADGTSGASAPSIVQQVGGKDGSSNLQPMSVDSTGKVNINNVSGTISLPTGASTSSLQTTGNTSLASIDTKTPALGQALAAASVPVVLTAAQLTTLTPLSTVAVTQSTSPWVTSRNWTLASGTDSVAAVQSGTWNINNISGTVSLPTGASTSAYQVIANSSLSTIATTLTLAQGSTTSGQTGNLALGAVTTSSPTYSTGTTNPVSITTSGAMRVDSSNSLTTVIDQYNQNIINGAAFSAILPINTVNINSTETNLYYIKNNGSKTVYIFSIQAVTDPSDGNTWAKFFIYYNPTVTVNGITVTPSNLLAGSAIASAANSYETPTTTSRGSLIDSIYQGYNNAASIVQQKDVYSYYVLPPSQSLLISGMAKANATTVNLAVKYFEV